MFVQSARAALTWDADGAGIGQTDGAGAWLGTDLWWDGAVNATWSSGSDAVFGVGGTSGAVTLASPTTAASISFISFTGTYTLGTVGQRLTINSGINLNAGSDAVTFISPIAIAGNQNWTNNDDSLLTVADVTNTADVTPFTLTANGSGTGGTTFGGIISNGGTTGKTALTVNTTDGTTILSAVNTYTGDTTLTAGTLQGTTAIFNANPGSPFGTSALKLNGGILQLRTGGTTGGPLGNVTAQTVTFGNLTTVGGTTTVDVGRTATATAATNKTVALGTLSIGANTLNVTGANTYQLTFGATTLTGNAIFNPTTANLNLGSVGGSGLGITKTGTGQLSITAAGTYTGTTTVEEGNLGPSNATALGLATTPIALGNTNSIDNNLNPSLLVGGAGTVVARDITVGASNAATGGIYTIGTGNVGSAAGLTGTVTLNQNLSVSALNHNNTFTLAGSGIISGSSGTQTVRFNTSGTGIILVSGVIGGGVGTIDLTKNAGAGTTILSGANTYTGPTTISVGVLQLGNGGTTGSLNPGSEITTNGTLAFNRTNTVTQGTDFDPVVDGGGGLRKGGTGLLLLNGANTYSGGTTVTAGILTVDTGGTLGATTGTLAVNNPNTGAATAVVLNLATAVDTTVGSLSGTIAAAVPAAPPNTATINNGGSGRNFTVNQTALNLNYNGVIAGDGNLTIGSLSTSSLGLGGANTYTGTTTIESGGITASNASALGNATTAVALGSADSITNNLSPTLQVNGNTTIARNITVGASTAATTGIYTIGTGNANSSATLNSTVTLNQNLTVGATNQAGGTFTLAGSVTSGSAGTQTVTIANTNQLVASAVIGGGTGTIALTKMGAGTATLTNANTYTGPTTISVGVLRLGNGGTTGSLSTSSAIDNNANLTINRSNAVAQGTDFSGAAIIGTGSFTQAGAGTTTLSAANSYTGVTAVNVGTLIVSGSLDSNAVNVAGAATLGGNGDIAGNVTIATNGIHSLAVAATVVGQATRDIGGTLDLTALDDKLVLTAAAAPAAGTYVLAKATIAITGTIDLDDITLVGVAGTVAIVGDELQLTVAPAAGYSAWATANAPGQTKDQDHDNDGVDNGIEYFMGLSGNGFTASPALSAGTVTWTKGGSYSGTYGTDFAVESSTDLVNWTIVPVGSGALGTVTDNAGSVTYTPSTGDAKRFGRLVVNN